MKKTLTALAVIFAFLSGTASAAPVGSPFLRGIKSPAELADKIETSLRQFPDGRAIIDDDRCLQDRSCATPQNFLEMFKESDPQAHLTSVQQVPNFLRTLEVAPAPKGEYWMACLKLTAKGAYRAVLHCVARSFAPGESAYMDPKTRRIVLAGNCANPVEKEVKDKCVEVHFFTKQQDTVVRFALLGPADVNDECIGVKRAGEVEFSRWWRDECADEDCNFSSVREVVGQPIRLAGSYVPQPGEHVLRLPALIVQKGSLFRVVLCLDRGGEHSDGIGVQWFDYRDVGVTPTAVVWYDKTQIPSGMPRLYWPWGEWSGGK